MNNVSSNGSHKSLAVNSVFYVIYNVLNVLFPLLTGIYVARVLLASDIGEVTYAQNIAQYFVIMSFLGIPTYGMREIAKVRDDKQKQSTLFSELVIINGISTLICLSIYIILIFTVQQFRTNIVVFLITGLSIAFNLLNINWLYEGLEEFKYISIRNIVFKSLCFVLLVCFVRSKDDYLLYAGLTVFGVAGNYFINVLYAPKFIRIVLTGIDLKRHIKPIILLVVVNLAIEIYSLVDVTMLGNISQKANVTFYSYAQRIQRILLHVINSFTIVIVPRIAYYYKHGQNTEFNRLISKTLKIIIILSLPMICGIFLAGDDIIALLYGAVYSPSASVLKILSFMLLISPIGYLLGSRVSLVYGQEAKMAICVGTGAIINIIGNYILIPRYNETGAAIASLISEISIMIIYLCLGHGKYRLEIRIKEYLKVFAALAIMTTTCLLVKTLSFADYLKTGLQIVFSVITCFVSLYILNESFTRTYINKAIKILRRNKKVG